MEESMGWNKGRVPAITLPESQAFSYALVFNQESKVFTPFGVVNLISSSDVWSKDTSHASFLVLRKFRMSHRHTELSFTGMLTSEPVAELQQKTQSAGLWDKSLAWKSRVSIVARTLVRMLYGLFEFSRCKDNKINQLVSYFKQII